MAATGRGDIRHIDIVRAGVLDDGGSDGEGAGNEVEENQKQNKGSHNCVWGGCFVLTV